MSNLGALDFNFGHGGAHPWAGGRIARRSRISMPQFVVSSNRWDFPRYYNPSTEIAPGLVINFIASWLLGRRAARMRRPGQRPWAWRASYVMGLMMVERTTGLLGVTDLPEDALQKLGMEAVVLAGEPRECWDVDGFECWCSRCAAPQKWNLRRSASYRERSRTCDQRGPPTACLWFGHKPDLRLPLPFFAGDTN